MSSPVEQIKQRLTVVDVVGSYIKLQKAGANFKAVCPFHSEKAPSFYVSPPREIWHCFGCGKGGDLFEFVKQIEGIEFVEALRILADRAGVAITYQNPEVRSEKNRLLDLLKDAVVFYQKNLAQNKNVLQYLWDRGLKNQTLKDFNIGFAPEEEKGWRNLFNFLKSKGYSTGEIEKAGLIIKDHDRFRGRIMFPLKDASGRVVGFSGRLLVPTPDVGKYINSPQTILYDKSKILYGFDLAKMEIRKQDACVLVEGQMDVLTAYQAGTQNTAAVSGTALTIQHLELIKRLTDNLIMAFDSDEAGLQAAKRSIDLALENDFEVRAISLPKEKDPADLIKENVDLWLDSVKNSVHIIEFYLKILKEKHSDDSRKFKLEVEKKVLPYLLLIQSGVDRSHWIKEIAKQLDVKEEIIFEGLKKIRIPWKKEKSAGADKPRGRKVILEERLKGIELWKKNSKDKLAFEAELYYGGTEDLEKEIGNLKKELKKEILKEKLGNLTEEVRKLEMEGKTEDLQAKLSEFRGLSKELTAI